MNELPPKAVAPLPIPDRRSGLTSSKLDNNPEPEVLIDHPPFPIMIYFTPLIQNTEAR